MDIQHQLIDIATRDVTCLTADDTIGEAARIMSQRRFSSIVITDETRRPVGIVTERNILHAMRVGFSQQTLLQTCMSAPVIVMPGTRNALDAYQSCLREGIRHLVLVDEAGAISGMVSETDFRLHLNLTVLAGRREVMSVAHSTVTSLPGHSSLLQALNLMQAQRESCVVVVENEKPVGIVTERDVVRFYAREPDRVEVPLFELMTSPVLTIPADATINQAAETMLEKKVRHLSVVDDEGRMVGLVSEHDLTQTMASGMLDEKFEIEEMFLRTFIDAIPDLVWLKDKDGVFLSCNRSFEQLVGAKKSEIIGRTDYDLVGKEQADYFREHDLKAMAADKPSVNEEWLTFASDGHRALFETIKTPMRDRRGQLVGILGVARDVSGRERSDHALFESERQYRTLAENTPDNIIRYDSQCRVLYVNPALKESLAAESLPVLGKSSREAHPKAMSAIEMQRVLERVIATGQRAELEVSVPSPAGEMRTHHIIYIAERDSKGGIVGALGIGRDISERIQAERLLALSEYRYRTLIENSPFCIHEIDRQGRLQSMNRAGLGMIGQENEAQVRGMRMLDWVGAADKTRIGELLQEAIAGKPSHFEFIPVGDPQHHFKSCFIPILGVDGKVQELMGLTEDITERKLAEEALRDSLKEYSDLVRSIPVGVYKYRMLAQGTVAFDYVSPRWCELLDVREEEVTRDPGAAFARLHPEERARFVRFNEEARQQFRRFEWEGRILRNDGEVRWLHIESQPTLLENGDILWDGIQYDVTDRRMAEDALRLTASVFDNSQEAIVITDANNRIIDVNPAFTVITGYHRDAVLGMDPKFLSSGRQDAAFYSSMWGTLREKKAWRGEIWNRRKNGEVYAELLSISAICDTAGNVRRHVAVFSDITYFKEHEAELSQVANYDALTGVPNRRLLADRLRQSIAHAQRSGKTMAVCYIDLDGFKDVNDQYGHEAGDLLLVEIAERLQEVLRAGDTLARLGGDEFIVLFNELAADEECFQVLDRIMLTIAAPVRLAGHDVAVSASIGVTFYPADNEDGDTLLRHADQAMYIAKQTGKKRYHIYDAIHDQRVRTMHESRRRILQGLESGEFELYYQPKLELASNRIVGVEALIRWNHPERGLLQPADFLPVIESSELECKLGRWVMGAALAQLHEWEKAGVSMQISINISARHLQSPDFVSELKSQLGQYPKLEHGRLQIEVLETAALEDTSHTFEIIKECRELGVSFALDDFGTGYSSLVYLRRLGADTLKIDQSFVQNMATNEGDRAIVEGVIALAKTFKRETVAEGMEDPKLVKKLSDMGCGYGQGYGIAHPMSAGEFLDWYKKR